MRYTRSERRFRIGSAVVFLLLAAPVLVPLFDTHQRTALDRTFRIAGGTVLILLAALSIYGPGGRRDQN
jgi:hypothetical protein